MLAKLGIPVLALATMLGFAPKLADARPGFGGHGFGGGHGFYSHGFYGHGFYGNGFYTPYYSPFYDYGFYGPSWDYAPHHHHHHHHH